MFYQRQRGLGFMLADIGNDALVSFIIFQAVFFILDIFIYTKTNRDIARKGEYTYFGAMILIHMCYLILNSIWTLGEFGVVHLPREAAIALDACSLSSVNGIAFVFFLFASEKIRFSLMWKLSCQVLSVVPVGLSLVLILSSPWTHMVFSLNDQNQIIHGPLYPAMLVSSSLYLVSVALLGGYNMIMSKTSTKKRSGAAVFFSVLLIMVFVVIDDMIDQASILPAAVFAVIIVVFINMQESNINSDALTGMNNRRRAMEYLSEKLGSVSEDSPLYLYMGDLNAFKAINDMYGHMEGDEALILCAEALKETASEYNGFAARFGGDEFLMIRKSEKGDDVEPDCLIGDVNRRMSRSAQEMGKPYSLSLSMGYVRCADRHESVHSYLEKADQMLYLRKREFHAQA